MPFIRMDIDAPDGPTTDDFILRPIVAADAELDYVIKSPSVGVWVINLPARLIAGVGNFIIGLAHSYGAP